MKNRKSVLLIVDKNPNVRGFLKREMEQDGYHIHTAENGRKALQWLYHQDRIDLVILDPDLPGGDKCWVLEAIWHFLPALPVVLHTFASVYAECLECPAIPDQTVFVEKGGSSVESLKQVVLDRLSPQVDGRQG